MAANDIIQVIFSDIGARGPQGIPGPTGSQGPPGDGSVSGSLRSVGVFGPSETNIGPSKLYSPTHYPDTMLASEPLGTSQSGSYIRLADVAGVGVEDQAGSIRLVPGKGNWTGDDDRGSVRISDNSGSAWIFDAAGRLRGSGSIRAGGLHTGRLPFVDALASSQSFVSNGRTWFVGDGAGPDGGGAQIVFNNTHGTLLSPSAILSGSRLGRVGATGYDGNSWELTVRSLIRFSALENWNPSAKGTSIEFFVTPQGTTDVALPLQIFHNRIVVDGTITASAFSGTANHALTAISASWAPSTEGAPATWASITGKPTGLVSSSTQITSVASSSYALTASYALNASITDWSSLAGKPVGLVSSSAQVSFGAITGVPSGLVSSSAQITSVATASYAVSASWAPSSEGGSPTWAAVTGKPNGLVSSSAQIAFTGIAGVPSGLVSSSGQVAFSGLASVPSGLVSASTQIPSVSFASTTTWTGVNNKPTGLVSASTQIPSVSFASTTTWNGVNNKPTGLVSSSAQIPSVSFATTAVTASYFSGSVSFPDGLVVTGSITATTGFNGTASYATQALSASWAPGGGGDWNSISGKPAGLVSSSTQIPSVSFASAVMWNGVNNKPTGLVSSSAQVAYGSITGVPTGIVSSSTQIPLVASSSIAATASYFSGSIGFPNGLVVTGSITASAFSGTSSYAIQALSASWAPGAGGGDWNSISGKPVGLVSSSAQVAYGSIAGVPTGIVSSSAQVPLVASSSYLVGNRSTISHVIASSGSIITTGYKGVIQLPFDCYIESASIFTNQSGSIAVDIRRQQNVLAWAPLQNNGTSITASASPLSQSNHVRTQNTTLTSWTRNLTTGDLLSVYVTAVSGSATFNNAVVSLRVLRS